jgi:hypothetical protein
MNNKIFDLIVFGVWLTLAIVVHYYDANGEDNATIQRIVGIYNPSPDSLYDVHKVTVLQGNKFDLWLSGGHRIVGQLPVSTIDGTKDKVIDLFNECSSPKVKLKKQEQEHWNVDLVCFYHGRKINLADWLVENKMAF